MGEYLREVSRKWAAQAQPDPGRRRVPGLSILYGVLALGYLVGAVVRPSILSAVGAVILLIAAWLWWLSERVPLYPDSRAARAFRERPEVRLALLSMISFFLGFFSALTGLIRGW